MERTAASDYAGSRSCSPALVVDSLLSELDQNVFSTALPTIVGTLHGVDQMLWVTTAYVLAATVTMPIYGKLGDPVGRRPLFVAALSVFVAGSLIGALSPDMTWLIAGRTVHRRHRRRGTRCCDGLRHHGAPRRRAADPAAPLR